MAEDCCDPRQMSYVPDQSCHHDLPPAHHDPSLHDFSIQQNNSQGELQMNCDTQYPSIKDTAAHIRTETGHGEQGHNTVML